MKDSIIVKRMDPGVRMPSSVTLSKLLKHFIPYLYNENFNSTYFIGLLRGLNKLTHAKHVEQSLAHYKY